MKSYLVLYLFNIFLSLNGSISFGWYIDAGMISIPWDS